MFNMGEQYFKGVLAGYLGANFMCGPITEWQIDIIKENISISRERRPKAPNETKSGGVYPRGEG